MYYYMSLSETHKITRKKNTKIKGVLWKAADDNAYKYHVRQIQQMKNVFKLYSLH